MQRCLDASEIWTLDILIRTQVFRFPTILVSAPSCSLFLLWVSFVSLWCAFSKWRMTDSCPIVSEIVAALSYLSQWLGGNDTSKMEPWWTMMNHEPWSLEKNLKIQSMCTKSNYENTKDIKRYCNWNTHVQHQKGHGVAPDGKTPQPRSPHISNGSYAANRGELWTDLKNDRSAYCKNQGKVTKEAYSGNSGMGNDVRLHTSKSPKSPPSSDLTWPKHLPHCQPSKGQFRSYSFSEHNLFKSPLALVHFLRVSRHIPPEDWLHGNQPLPTNCQQNKV